MTVNPRAWILRRYEPALMRLHPERAADLLRRASRSPTMTSLRRDYLLHRLRVDTTELRTLSVVFPTPVQKNKGRLLSAAPDCRSTVQMAPSQWRKRWRGFCAVKGHRGRVPMRTPMRLLPSCVVSPTPSSMAAALVIAVSLRRRNRTALGTNLQSPLR